MRPSETLEARASALPRRRPPSRRTWPDLVGQALRNAPGAGAAVARMALVVTFAALRPAFLSASNLESILDASAIPVVLVIGMSFIIIQGSIDLSVEGVTASVSMITALLIANSTHPAGLGCGAVVAGLLAGTAFGIVNGLFCAYARVPSLIVTLATWLIGNGVAILLFPGQQPRILNTRLTRMAVDLPVGISPLVLIAGALAIGAVALSRYTQFGRMTYAIGSDERLLEQSGLPVRPYKLLAFALMGLLSAVAGIMISAQLSVGNPYAGQGYLFPTISAAVIGGTILSGGRGGVVESILGVLVLQVLQDGMVQLGIDPYLRHVVEGVTIVGTLVAGTWAARSRLRVVK